MRSYGIRHRAVCAALLASCVLVADAHAGVFRLRRTVVVGDSLLAGFGSGGLVGVGRPGQVDSAPAFVARRAHVRLPLRSEERRVGKECRSRWLRLYLN